MNSSQSRMGENIGVIHNKKMSPVVDDEFAISNANALEEAHDEEDCSSIIDHNDSDGVDDVDDDDSRSQTKSDSTLDELDIQGISLLSEIFPDASREELEELHFQRVETVTKLNTSTSQGNLKENDSHANEICMNKGSANAPAHNHTNNNENEKMHEFQRSSNKERSARENEIYESVKPEKDALFHVSSGSHATIAQIDHPLPSKTKLKPTLTSILPLTSNLGRRILRQSDNFNNTQYTKLRDCLSDDFLRIPSRRSNHFDHRGGGTSNLKDISSLEKTTIETHLQHGTITQKNMASSHISTAVFTRDMYVGLGLQLRELKGCVYANALTCRDGRKVTSEEMYRAVLAESQKLRSGSLGLGPALNAGVRPGDRILGVDGKAFLGFKIDTVNKKKQMSSSEILAEAARIIANTCDPIALHIMRERADESFNAVHSESSNGNVQRPDNNSKSNSWQIVEERPSLTPRAAPLKLVHPIAIQLSKSGIIKSGNQRKVSEDLALYTNRSLMWRENQYLTNIIVDERNLPDCRKNIYPAFRKMPSNSSSMCSFNDSSIVRQALCIHLVNTFIDEDRLAFTIWVYDVESCSEWYAPVRYFQDFCDLRVAVSRLDKNIEKLPFPSNRWFHESEASSSHSFKEARCYELEVFLRSLCTMLYKEEKLPEQACISEVALYIQTFLGCDAHINYETSKTVSNTQIEGRRLLQRVVQLYTFRIFLLPSVNSLVGQFIIELKKSFALFERRKTVSKTSGAMEKEKTLLELSRVKHFNSSIIKLIYDGCSKDFDLIIKNAPYGSFLVDKNSIILEAIREQVEIHAYVPIRSLVSRLLVFGWRYDDKEIYFKMQVLKEKSQTFFKIKSMYQSPSQWQSVIDILTCGVGQSTLPCHKLRAVVDAGKEVGQLSKIECNADPLGADDFLPIFIYCFVRAEIERPCALAILLRNLCDDDQLLGEIGYYLSSFEAAIAYIHDLDLSCMD